jgi:hypothetical protein
MGILGIDVWPTTQPACQAPISKALSRFATTKARLAYCGVPRGTARSERDCCRSVTTPVRECNAEFDSKNPETTRDE